MGPLPAKNRRHSGKGEFDSGTKKPQHRTVLWLFCSRSSFGSSFNGAQAQRFNSSAVVPSFPALFELPAYLQKDVAAITDRTRATYDHGNNEQPDYFETAEAV